MSANPLIATKRLALPRSTKGGPIVTLLPLRERRRLVKIGALARKAIDATKTTEASYVQADHDALVLGELIDQLSHSAALGAFPKRQKVGQIPKRVTKARKAVLGMLRRRVDKPNPDGVQ